MSYNKDNIGSYLKLPDVIESLTLQSICIVQPLHCKCLSILLMNKFEVVLFNAVVQFCFVNVLRETGSVTLCCMINRYLRPASRLELWNKLETQTFLPASREPVESKV